MSEARSVAIIGAGPVGLAAAAHVLARGLRPIVLEAGDKVGPAVRQLGSRSTVLAVGIQHRPRGGAPAWADGLEFSCARSVSDRC